MTVKNLMFVWMLFIVSQLGLAQETDPSHDDVIDSLEELNELAESYRSKGLQWYADLVGLLGSQNPYVREDAARKLSDINPSLYEYLKSLTEDERSQLKAENEVMTPFQLANRLLEPFKVSHDYVAVSQSDIGDNFFRLCNSCETVFQGIGSRAHAGDRSDTLTLLNCKDMDDSKDVFEDFGNFALPVRRSSSAYFYLPTGKLLILETKEVETAQNGLSEELDTLIIRDGELIGEYKTIQHDSSNRFNTMNEGKRINSFYDIRRILEQDREGMIVSIKPNMFILINR